MGRKKGGLIHRFADFETTTKEEDCRVWSWGIADVTGDPEASYRDGTNIESFIDFVSQEASSVVWFHNLAFDGNFLISWLLNNGFEHKENTRALYVEQFSTLISKMGKFYQITVRWANGSRTEFRDSIKKLPMSISRIADTFNLPESKGVIDYHKHRPVGYIPSEVEREYQKTDVLIGARAVKILLEQNMKKLTIGADSLAEYKGIMGKTFNKMFPVLAPSMDMEIRKAYRGGFTYADPRFKGREVGAGSVYDVNSLYPAVMYDRVLPFGEPLFYNGAPKKTESRPLWIASITLQARLKPDHIPTIQIKNSLSFLGTEYLSVISEPTTLYMTNVDWELWNRHYDIKVLSFNGYWAFKGSTGFFNKYIDKWTEVKETSSGGMREIAKLHLNSLYGKFASNPDVTGKIPVLGDDGVVRYVLGTPSERDAVYTAMGVFITAYAREVTIDAAQAHYDVFAYADTDSLHLLTDRDSVQLEIDDKTMGKWAHEMDFVKAFYARAKQYTEQTADGVYHTRVAGLPHALAKKVTIDSFVNGEEFHGKKMPKRVPGGIVLSDTTFKLRGTDN